MHFASARRGLIILLAIQLILFLFSLPGLGIETRAASQYKSWAGPIFLILTLLIFVTGLIGVVLAAARRRAAASSGIAMGVLVIAIVAFDLSGLAGPAAPLGPILLSVAVLIVSILIFIVAGAYRRAAGSSGPPASAA